MKLGPELNPDPGVYVASQVQAGGIHFHISLPGQGLLDRIAAFT